jgi:preprotein translocase SecE subunit
VARSTRQQRRQRRSQQQPALAGGPPARPPAPPTPPVAKGDKEPRQPRPERRDEVRSGTPGIRFLQESWAELKKVEWPNQQQLISGTAVVLIACLITGVYLYANDRLWEYIVKHVLLS